MEGIEKREKLPEIEVVLASEKDAEGIRNVQRDMWIATYPNEEYGITKEDIESKDWDNPARVERWKAIALESSPIRRVWVAKEGERVVGFCAALKEENKNKLTAIYVLPETQGKSVGTKLMQQALGWLGSEKDTVVEVAKYNLNAIEFYKRFGFEGEQDIPAGPVADLPSGKTIPEIQMIRKSEEKE
jgi:ribosomal protein S18 acetylase RimI-like enzyme